MSDSNDHINVFPSRL